MTTLSDAQLGQIAENIFVMGDRAKTSLPLLPTPAIADPPDPPDPPDPHWSALHPIGAEAEFNAAGIGVIDFTEDPLHPKVWLHNGLETFRIGSASKIAMMLAAVQLRADVRRILELNIISTPDEFDELFRNPKLWQKAKAPRSENLQQAMSGSDGRPPLISEIFDFKKSPVDFKGGDPDGRTDPDGTPNLAVQQAIVDGLDADFELPWATWNKFDFSERLWLTGSLSDNVAATSCISQIGVPYIKAVQRSYGLAKMHLLASAGYTGIPASSTLPAPLRQLRNKDVEPLSVDDYWWEPKTHAFTDKRSWVPGSAAALAAYMIGLMTNGLGGDIGPPAISLLDRALACRTIRSNLADSGPNTTSRFLIKGVKLVPGTNITRQFSKLGFLAKETDKKKEPAAKLTLICEFVYLETKQVPPPPRREVMKYAVITTGVISEPKLTDPDAGVKCMDLGTEVHEALLKL